MNDRAFGGRTIVHNGGLDGDDFVDEPARVNRGNGSLVAEQRERVLLLPGDVRFAGVIFGDEPGAQVDVRVLVHQRRIGRDGVAAHRDEAHRLGAASHDGLREAAHDSLGSERNRLQA